MSQISMVLYRFGESEPLARDFVAMYSHNSKFELKEINDSKAANDHFQGHGNGIFIFKIANKDDLQEAIAVLKSQRKLLRKNLFRSFALLPTMNSKVEKILSRYGCTDVFSFSMNPKALSYKVDYWAKPIWAQLEKIESEITYRKKTKEAAEKSGSLKSKEIGGAKSTNKDDFEWLEALDLPSDIWIIKNKKVDCKKVLRRWLIKVHGPSSRVGHWEETEPQPGDKLQTWKFVEQQIGDNKFVKDDGAWFFYGSKPDFDWKEKAWNFSSEFPHLYFYEKSGEVYSRFKFKSDQVLIAENSDFALMRELAFIDTSNDEVIGNSFMQLGAGNIIGKARTESVDNGHMTGSVKQGDNLDDPGSLTGKSSTDKFGEEALSGKGSTDKFGEEALSGKGGTDKFGEKALSGKGGTDKFGEEALSGEDSTDKMGEAPLAGKASTDSYGNDPLSGESKGADQIGGDLSGKGSAADRMGEAPLAGEGKPADTIGGKPLAGTVGELAQAALDEKNEQTGNPLASLDAIGKATDQQAQVSAAALIDNQAQAENAPINPENLDINAQMHKDVGEQELKIDLDEQTKDAFELAKEKKDKNQSDQMNSTRTSMNNGVKDTQSGAFSSMGVGRDDSNSIEKRDARANELEDLLGGGLTTGSTADKPAPNLSVVEDEEFEDEELPNAEDISLESGELKVVINQRTEAGNVISSICEFEDFYEEELVVQAPKGVIPEGVAVEASVILSYGGKNINVECKGKVLEVDESDNDKTETLAIELENLDLKKYETFMTLFQERQQSISDFMKVAKGF